jgi:beta-lactamase family protein
VQFTLDRPMVAEPGTTFSYCSPGMHLLSAVLTRATGMSELDFARRNLFEPLGIRDVIWPADPQGLNHGWGDLYLYPRDAAKLGYLWLHRGVWDGKQVVSAGWVASSVAVHAAVEGRDADYGYGWWIQRASEVGGEYDAVGRGGQQVEVLPALDAVIVTVGGGFEPGEATDLLAPALIDPTKPLPANPAGEARLSAALASVRRAPAPGPVPPLPATSEAISGKTWVFEPNPAQLELAQLAFDRPGEATFRFRIRGVEELPPSPVGLDGVYRMSPGDHGFAVGQRGRWEDAATFVLERDEIANRNANLVRMRFEGNTVVVVVKERTHQAGRIAARSWGGHSGTLRRTGTPSTGGLRAAGEGTGHRDGPWPVSCRSLAGPSTAPARLRARPPRRQVPRARAHGVRR